LLFFRFIHSVIIGLNADQLKIRFTQTFLALTRGLEIKNNLALKY